ncbi:hypothetical protein BDV10DRAFT_197109 [Aspergillus recurvatus]
MKTHNASQSAGQHAAYLPEGLPADDWYGVSDAKEPHRFRTRLERIGGFMRSDAQWHLHTTETCIHPPLLIESTCQPQRALSGQVAKPGSTLSSCLSGRPNREKDAANTIIGSRFPTSSRGEVDTLWAEMPDAYKMEIMLQQMAQFHASYLLNCPSADHLLSLTRINVHRAFVNNMVTLGITWEWMKDDSISPFSMARPGFFDLDHAVVPLPDSLRPTELQRKSVHHTRIDLFPCPLMRNNLIQMGNDWDDEELCTDIMGFWDGTTATGPFGLIIWGEPSDPRAWEITEGFFRKWGWVIHGCLDLMWSTNYWRAKRGERPLFSMIEVYRRLGENQTLKA